MKYIKLEFAMSGPEPFFVKRGYSHWRWQKRGERHLYIWLFSRQFHFVLTVR